LPERLPLKKSTNFYVPLSTWREITQAEAQATYQQGIPVLLYGEHTWEHPSGSPNTWGANRNMRALIDGNARVHPDAVSGTDHAVCYLDLHGGTFSNDVWKAWFSSDTAVIFDDSAASATTFLTPCFQFPYTTHYTVIASDGHVHEYADIAGAIQGFQSLPPRKTGRGGQAQIVFPQFCYYHEVSCPSGVYRIEFFGPHMDEQGYVARKAA
jgi:hypothetical protein